MKKLASVVAALVMVPMLFASTPVFADSPGQLSNSPTNYKVRNVTQNGSYGQSTTAACGETVKYSVILANSDFGQLTNLTVKANLASGAISASAKNVAGNTTSVSGSATVNTTGTLEYVNGSTVRIASDTTTRTALGDGVATASGVNAGTLAGSTYIYVQFEAKVKCATPPVTPPQPPTTTTTTQLVKTGPGDVVALFAVVAAAGVVAYNWVLRRQTR